MARGGDRGVAWYLVGLVVLGISVETLDQWLLAAMGLALALFAVDTIVRPPRDWFLRAVNLLLGTFVVGFASRLL